VAGATHLLRKHAADDGSIGELETGHKVDNVRAVNTEIVSLLRMDFTAFKSAVLLPQGQFATLLHATPADRTKLLRGIFGADLVEVVHDLATTGFESLADLVHGAELARAQLLPKPAEAAVAADADAARFKTQATELAEHMERVGGLLEEARISAARASAAQQASLKVASAATALGPDTVDAPLEAASLAAADLASRAALLDRTQEQARARLQQSQEALADADARGASRSAVTAAASMLDALPDRARSLFDDADELRAEGDRVEQESRRLQATDADAALQLADVERLEAAAGHARTAAQAVASASAALRESVAGVLTAADAVSAAAQAEYELTTAVAGLADNLVGLRVAAADSARLAQNAADETAVLRRTSAAATAAAGLHPGDDCSVCARKLPADWHAPDSATDTALAAAAQTEDQLRTQASKAAGTVNAVEHLLKQRGGDLQTAQNRHQLAWSTLNGLLTDLANSPELVLLARPTDVADAAPVDETALLAGVNTAARVVAAAPTDSERRTATLEELCGQAAGLSSGHAAASLAADHAAVTARGEHTATVREAAQARVALERDTASLVQGRARWRRDVDGLWRALDGLPAQVRVLLPATQPGQLPDWLANANGSPLTAAARALKDAQQVLAGLERARDEATVTLDTMTEARKQLAADHSVLVTGPLRRVCRIVTQAAAALPESGSVELADDDEEDPSAVCAYATRVRDELATASASLADAVRSTSQDAATSIARAAGAWRVALAAIGTDAPTDDMAVLAPEALRRLTDAAAVAANAAQQLRAQAEAARAQVPRAAALDEAVTAGKARLAALSALKGLLRTKFPTHLVSRRTTALLGLASELFGRLSGGEFGFADGFEVAARRSGVSRDPKTLSGGETFLASLSLALSLVELYSRSGGRLGALFLDEGFGALDTDTLGAALEALQIETGQDKLVAVISHLHAVAEAVRDVLWVERAPAGSEARWLTGEEVERLVRDDAVAGLLALT
jgi:DNA repair protein SbcC/Rad50